MTEMAMPEGVIGGGWSYVIAAYGITGLVLGGYLLLLHRERTRLERQERPGSS